MSLTVTIDLPVELERALRASERDLGVAAKEALAVSLFRQAKLSHAELGSALNLDRFETDALLKRHQVTAGGLTLADLEMDRAALEEVFGTSAHMIVVADSSPLVALVNIKQIEILPRLFGAVLIPPAVHSELLSPRRPPELQAFAARPPSWLEVRTPQSVEAIPGLHLGEQAALSLAAETKADLILMDEKAGRRIAAERHLAVAGTVGVLERAADQQLLNLRDAFDLLKATDFWVSPALLDARLEAFEQKQSHGRTRNPSIER